MKVLSYVIFFYIKDYIFRKDYDEWSEMGNSGWSYKEVLPYFKKSESFRFGDWSVRGESGPMKVRPAPFISKYCKKHNLIFFVIFMPLNLGTERSLTKPLTKWD